ncbi:MAG: hypothetical protein ABIP51_00035 [Bacteroidia bacterium]
MTTKKRTRVENAKERKTEYDTLTVAEKIAKLDRVLGKGIGATKERAKLATKL